MLDPKTIRNARESVAAMLRARHVEFDLDWLARLDQQRRSMILKTDALRQQRNATSQAISARKKAGKDLSKEIAAMKAVSSELEELEAKQQKVDADYARLSMAIPNMLDGSVPPGDSSDFNVQVGKWGAVPRFEFAPRGHTEISEDLGLVDLKRAAKVAGARFYYLRDDLVRLNQSLLHFALDFLAGRGYMLVQPPYMINRSSMEGAVIAEDFEDVIYKIADEDLYMIGTSEHAMAAMHSGEILAGASLPLRYAGISPCFRKEAGAHGRDQKGIFRVHQFDKVEQFVFARPEESRDEHDRMLKIAEEFYQKLGIPYRVMLLCAGDLGKVSAKTYDIEAWMAGQKAYREVVSCSNCLEYQARRLKVRFRDRTSESTSYVHTLNSTLVATTRVLVSIMENFQTGDGHVRIPDVLQRYMGGAKEIVRRQVRTP